MSGVGAEHNPILSGKHPLTSNPMYRRNRRSGISEDSLREDE